MSLVHRLRAVVRGGPGTQPIVFVHGFGCGQEMWRHVAPSFEDDHRVVTFDLPGSGNADPSTYDPDRHGSLEGYRDDVIALLDELELRSVVLVGHSVSSMIAVLVQVRRPDLVARLVLVTPSARYLDDEDDGYAGGFAADDVDDFLALMSRNHLGWQDSFAALVAGPEDQDARRELEQSFCRTRPEVAEQFASVTFRGDNRTDLSHVSVPTLVIQSRFDTVAPVTAGEFVAARIAGSSFDVLDTWGHCPQLTSPEETVGSMRRFLVGAED